MFQRLLYFVAFYFAAFSISAQTGTITNAGTLRVPAALQFNGLQNVGHFCSWSQLGRPPLDYSFEDFVNTPATTSDGQQPIYRWEYQREGGPWEIATTLQGIFIDYEKMTKLRRRAAHPDSPLNFSNPDSAPLIELGIPTGPSLNIISSTDANCGLANGTLTVSQTSNSKYPYSAFTAQHSSGVSSTVYTSTTANVTINNLRPGTYQVSIFRPCYTCDPNNSVCNKTATVGVVGDLGLSIPAPSPICQGESVTLTAQSAVAGVTYNWSTGQQGSSIQVTPQSTTTFSVTVSKNGCADVKPTTVTVKPSPGAQITSNQPNSICFGLGARLSGTGNGSFLWSNGSTGPFINIAPSNVGNYNYGLTVTGSNGCVSSTNFPITVKPLPTASISPASSSYCPGQSPVALTASGGTSFLWSTGATSSSIAVSPVQNTTYSVTATQNGCTASSTATVNVANINVAASKDNTCPGEQVTLTASGGGTYSWTGGSTGSSISVSPTQTTTYTVTSVLNGCTRTATITVNVVSSSALSISPSVADICAGDSITLAANGGSGQYTWSTGASTSSIKVSPSGTTTYSVTLNQSGCISAANRIVSVRSRPNASVSPTSSSVCPGQSVNLVASGGNTYSWTTGATTASITVNPTVNTNYQVTVSNTLGCSVVLNAQVTMGGPPATISPATANICAGDSITLTASGGTAYNWSNGRTTASIKVAPSATTTYSVTVSSGSCAGVIERTVNVQAKPNASILPLNATICAGQSITLAGNGGGTYNWSNNATTSSITVTPGASTTYTLTVTNNGCSSVVTKQVVVNNNNFSLSASNTSICLGQSVTLTASGGTAYSWTTGGTGSSITVSPTTTTTYVVTITNGTCSATLDRTITVAQPPSASISPSNANICSGQNIALTASGGDIFSWSNGATTSSISVAPTATTVYTVTVSRNGCAGTSTASRTVNVSTTPIAGINASASTICNGQSTTLSATGTGTYSWSNGATTSSIVVSPNAFTTYFVTVNNAGCTAVASRDIVVNSTVASITADRTTLCTGQNAQLSAGGGGTYLWNTGATSPTISVVPTATTTYTVTATNNNCSSTATITITVNTGLSPSISGPTVICTGGSATISTTGGTSYLWSTGATTSAITVNNAGTYQVTVSNNSCSGIANRAMTLATNPTIDIGDAPLCTGTARNIIASEGSSYGWSTGATTRQITVSTNGTYTVSVTKDGCTNSVSRALTFNAVPTAAITGEQNICASSTSVFTASGGTSYAWSNAATTASIVIGTAGTYTVTVSNNGGCTATASRVLNVSTSSSQTAIASVGVTNDGDCTAGNARIQVNLVNSISANYRLVGVRNWQTSNVFTNLPSGTYNLEVSTATNGSACVDRKTVVVDEKLVTITGVVVTGNDDCTANNFMAKLQYSASPITAPQFRLYINGLGAVSSWGSTTTFTSADVHFENNYRIQAKSSTGCIVQSSSFARNEPEFFPAIDELSIVSGDDDCIAGNTKVLIKLTPFPPSMSTPENRLAFPVQYRINGFGNFTPYNDFENLSRDSILAEVTYKYQRWYQSGEDVWTMIDERTCNVSRKLFVPEKTPPVANITPASVSICPDQSTNLTASGGNTYAWSNGQTTAIINVAPTATTTYTVTVSDNGTCPITKTVTVTVLPRPSVSVSRSPSLLGYCAGQSVTLSPSAGFASYLWTTGSSDRVITVAPLETTLYKVTVTGANGCTSVIWTNIEVQTQGRISPSNPVICNGQSVTLMVQNRPQNTTFQWSNGQTTSSITVNPNQTTTYSVTITQPLWSCGSVSTRQVIVNPSPNANVTGNAACAGQNTTLTATGGTNYLWSTGATTNTVSVPASPNMYSVTVSDANSCSTVVSRSVTNSPPLQVSATILNPLCAGQTGSITLSTTGLSPFTYQWTGGASTASRSGLSPGSYAVTITDGNNCTQVRTYTITAPSPLAFQLTAKNQDCFSGNTGEIEAINVSGGTAPYNYSWSNGVNGTSTKISNLAFGTYTLTLSDANACVISASATVNRPTDIVIAEAINPLTCSGGSNGQISLSISGGTGPYAYAWTGGGTTSVKSGLSAGNHTATVTDSKGCTKSKTFNITSPAPLLIAETITQVTCNGGSNGQIALNVTGGTAPYTYNWLSGGNTAINSGLSVGSHGVTVTDANNCTVSKSIAVGQPSPIAISETITDVSCNGGSNGQVSLSVSGGLAPYTYSWTGGGTSSSKSGLAAGSHTVTVTDANNCPVNKSIVVNQPNALSLSLSTTNAICAAQSNGQATALAGGGTSPYTYNWTNGGTNATNTTLSSGSHFLTLTDAKGCLLVQSFNISAPLPIVINETITNVVCAGQNTGQIDLNVSGGVTPYSFAWTGGGNGAVKSGLTAGIYVVTVTDAQGCNSTKNITVSSPAPLAYNVSVDNNNDCLLNNVTLTIAATGGSGNYSYRLNSGVFQSSALFSGISNGFYTITLKDGAGCSHSSPTPFQVAEALPLSLSVQLIGEEDCIANNTQVLPTLANAQGGATFLIAPLGSQSFSDSLMNKGSGVYILKAEDGRNCVLIDTVIISETLSPVLNSNS